MNSSALENESFRERICVLATADPEIPEARRLKAPVSLSVIVDAVSAIFATPKKDIRKPAEGRGKKNHARAANQFVRLTEENPKFNRFV